MSGLDRLADADAVTARTPAVATDGVRIELDLSCDAARFGGPLSSSGCCPWRRRT